MKDYKVEIAFCSKELTARERIQLKDLTNATKIEPLTENEALVIPVAFHAELHVTNPASEDKEYNTYVFVDNDGNKFYSGSESLWSSFKNIYDEMLDAGETEFAISISRLPSKKREGKHFLTCSLV